MATGLRRIKTTNSSLHYQTQLYLRDLIENGTYVPGQKFPSEESLQSSWEFPGPPCARRFTTCRQKA